MIITIVWMLNFCSIQTLKKPCGPCLGEDNKAAYSPVGAFLDGERNCCNGGGSYQANLMPGSVLPPVRPITSSPPLSIEALDSDLENSTVISGKYLTTLYESVDQVGANVEGLCCTKGVSSQTFSCGAGKSCINQCDGAKVDKAIVVSADVDKRNYCPRNSKSFSTDRRPLQEGVAARKKKPYRVVQIISIIGGGIAPAWLKWFCGLITRSGCKILKGSSENTKNPYQICCMVLNNNDPCKCECCKNIRRGGACPRHCL